LTAYSVRKPVIIYIPGDINVCHGGEQEGDPDELEVFSRSVYTGVPIAHKVVQDEYYRHTHSKLPPAHIVSNPAARPPIFDSIQHVNIEGRSDTIFTCTCEISMFMCTLIM